jgi:hypothetical protein
MPLQARLLRKEVLPFVLYMVALVASTLVIDAALHLLNIVWIGRWLATEILGWNRRGPGEKGRAADARRTE